jgi:hypothetical protein
VFGTLALLAGATGEVHARQQPAIFHLPVALADLSVVADTLSGLSVILQPSVTTRQQKEGYVWIRFHPDSAVEWVNSAFAAIRTAVAGDQAEGIQWSRSLVPLNRRGAITLGRSRKKGNLQKTHWLAISDSATGWRLELTGAQADSLLRLLFLAGTRSGIDTSSSAPLADSPPEVPVRIVKQAELSPREMGGRVLAQWVVGADGLMEPGSFLAILASDPDLISEALETVRRSRFLPAERGGKPVRQLVEQVFSWYPRKW